MALIQPGDLIQVRIWREPDLSGEFLVGNDGTVTLPKLGRVTASEASAEALKAALIRDYHQYLRNPSIDVVHLRRISILGAVKSPGVYSVDPTLSIVGAVALAGGATPDGKRREVELVRGGSRTVVEVSDVMKIADLPLRSGDQLFVPERSWISRNPGLIATAVSAGVSLIIAVFIR